MSMRPTFELIVDHPSEEVMERLKETLAHAECPCRGEVFDHQIEIRICPPQHHYWSPELNLLIAPSDQPSTRLHGKFGPGAHVWTLFMAGYAIFGMSIGAGLLIALSQWSLGTPLWGAWFVVAGLLGCALVWAAAGVGQRLAAPQMEDIRKLVHETFHPTPALASRANRASDHAQGDD